MSISQTITDRDDWLHNAHVSERLEAKRALNGALDRITPRAA